ncbi:MAG: glutathione S-transferase [Myxococcales bacterium]|nr:glutathione S-transferase [Myxococcales bacterium]
MSSSPRLVRLITIPISHYCERARWALDHAGLSFVEEQHLQMFHWRYVKAAGGTKTVPVLVLEDGGVLRDSSEIVRYASDATASGQGLYSGEPALDREILRLERGFCEPFGVEARRVMYYHFFRWGRPALRFNAGRAPRWERRVLELGFPLASRFMHRYLDISADTERAGRAVVDRVFDEVGERLAGGKRFLVGERFTAADLTFACGWRRR